MYKIGIILKKKKCGLKWCTKQTPPCFWNLLLEKEKREQIEKQNMSPQQQDSEETLVEAALRVLNTADPYEKARLGDSVASQWLQGTITQPYDPSLDLPVPDRPARLANVHFFSNSMPICYFAFQLFDEMPQ